MAKKTTVSCAERLKVLADETRLKILRELMHGPLHVGELNKIVQLEESLLSYHLRVLRTAKLVTALRDGKSVLYRLTVRQTEAPKLDLGCCSLLFPSKS